MMRFIIKTLLFFIVLFILLLLSMCIRYIPENHYILLDEKKVSVEKEAKIINDNSLNLKNIRLLSDTTILFEFYDIPNNLVLEKVELFYQNKMIGTININKEINSLENYGNDYFDESGRKIKKRGYLLQKDFFGIMGEDYEKYDITYPKGKFELTIYLKNLNTNEIFEINRSFSLYFKKKGYEFFILSV